MHAEGQNLLWAQMSAGLGVRIPPASFALPNQWRGGPGECRAVLELCKLQPKGFQMPAPTSLSSKGSQQGEVATPSLGLTQLAWAAGGVVRKHCRSQIALPDLGLKVSRAEKRSQRGRMGTPGLTARSRH